MAIDTTVPRTRRAILLGALGATAASVAATVDRASPASAENGDPVLLGRVNVGTRNTEVHMADRLGVSFIATNTTGSGVGGTSGSGTGVYGYSSSGSGVSGSSGSGHGVRGWSLTYPGVYGVSHKDVGVYGHGNNREGVRGSSDAVDAAALIGKSYGNSTGVIGHSGTETLPAALQKTGVYGVADQDAASIGVRGASSTGRGAVFSGNVAQLRLKPSAETTHPSTGAAGDLFLDRSCRLWLCIGGANWKQVQLA